MERKTNKATSWSGVKAKLADFDRAGLIGLIQDLYAAGKDNQAFLHARFGLGEDVLSPYKAIMDRWLWPDLYKRQNASVAKAKKAVLDYKKAVGQPEGQAELEVYYCERAAGFSDAVGLQDDGYFDALVRMFERAWCVCRFRLPIETPPRTGSPWCSPTRQPSTRRGAPLGHGDDHLCTLLVCGELGRLPSNDPENVQAALDALLGG